MTGAVPRERTKEKIGPAKLASLTMYSTAGERRKRSGCSGARRYLTGLDTNAMDSGSAERHAAQRVSAGRGGGWFLRWFQWVATGEWSVFQ